MLGALIFRGVFIVLGAALLQYGWVVILFGVFLILIGIQVMFSAERQVQPEQSLVVRGLRRLLPVATESEGPRFFVRQNGKLCATPILLVLAFIEARDILFALDSVPAFFAITREPLVVYTSNVFAILGLRNVFSVDRYPRCPGSTRLGQGHFPTSISVGVIVGILALLSVCRSSFALPARRKTC